MKENPGRINPIKLCKCKQCINQNSSKKELCTEIAGWEKSVCEEQNLQHCTVRGTVVKESIATSQNVKQS